MKGRAGTRGAATRSRRDEGRQWAWSNEAMVTNLLRSSSPETLEAAHDLADFALE